MNVQCSILVHHIQNRHSLRAYLCAILIIIGNIRDMEAHAHTCFYYLYSSKRRKSSAMRWECWWRLCHGKTLCALSIFCICDVFYGSCELLIWLSLNTAARELYERFSLMEHLRQISVTESSDCLWINKKNMILKIPVIKLHAHSLQNSKPMSLKISSYLLPSPKPCAICSTPSIENIVQHQSVYHSFIEHTLLHTHIHITCFQIRFLTTYHHIWYP